MFPDLEFIKTVLNGLRSRIEKVENWVVSFVRTNRPNWAQNDPDALDYVKGRTHWEEETIVDMPGASYIITGFTSAIWTVTHDEIPFELGQVWSVQGEQGWADTNVEVQQAADGVLYLGTPTVDDKPFYITKDTATINRSFQKAYDISSLALTCASGSTTVHVVHSLNPKFLPSPTSNTAGAIKADAAEITDIQPVRLGADGKLYSSREIPIFTTSGIGSAYKADVPEITKLVDGMLVVMVPHVASTTDVPTLNINGFGAYSIYRFLSSTTNSNLPGNANWLGSGVPVLLMYSSSRWFACNLPKPHAQDLHGQVLVSSGGTGQTSLTKGSYLVGNNRSSVLLKTPAEVLADIGAIPTPITAEVGQAIVVKAVDENGKPTEWEAADMTSGVQPDWNQNDVTQPDYVKNRPLYTGGPVETTFVEDSTVSFTRNEYSGFYAGLLQSTFVATVGETYKVSWDGTTYESTCVGSNGYTVIGNLSMMGTGSDTGEPFIMIVQNRVGIEIATADTSASHTFSISGFIPEIVKIDRKYLPKAASIIYDSSNKTYNSDLTNDELYEIMLNGEQVIFYNQSEKLYYYLKKWRLYLDGRIGLSFAGEEFEIVLFPDGTIGKNSPE